jgi:hypothetical protein
LRLNILEFLAYPWPYLMLRLRIQASVYRQIRAAQP